MNKNLLIWIIGILLLVSSASAYEYVFQQNQLTDIKVPCIDANNQYCDIATKCNITINYPNSSNLIANKGMTRTTTYYNYTFTPSELGEYPTQVNCLGTTNGFTSFNILITFTGKEPPSDFTKVFFILLFIALISTLIYVFLLGFIHLTKWDTDLLDVAMSFGLFFVILSLKYFNLQYMGSYIIDTFSDWFIDIGIYTHMLFPLVSFVVSYIKRRMEFKEEDEL